MTSEVTMEGKRERFDRHVRRELVGWREAVSHALLGILIFSTGFLWSTGVYPPVFGAIVLVALVGTWICSVAYWNRKAQLRNKENKK
ncbi:hypothetical protein ACFXPA_10035 [Amycolatopsis sp. NPDC059090]|uniref:hypothetical protein n=1 Tax=unclassified Amycolatopsis TaxID=2618356 RepID=UPI00366CB360